MKPEEVMKQLEEALQVLHRIATSLAFLAGMSVLLVMSVISVNCSSNPIKTHNVRIVSGPSKPVRVKGSFILDNSRPIDVDVGIIRVDGLGLNAKPIKVATDFNQRFDVDTGMLYIKNLHDYGPIPVSLKPCR
ncbi:hypothetical protein LCGC14_0469830 [marine sediment metagenome]|uniref:Uncharacterized protein n=1 Tax=marine sediment metagenome TaxID=412755 RepID=A0A0F9VLH4_9ZZZZ